MHACLAKPLDWVVIQLARRYLKRHEAGKAQAILPLPETSWDLPAAPAPAPADFRLAPDGNFRFASPVLTPAAQNNTVHGRLFPVEAHWERYRTVVLLHGWNAEWCYLRMFPRLAEDFKTAGINTVTLELPYHLQRRPRQGPIDDFISSDLPGMVQAARQAIADIRALCGWLDAQGSAAGLWGFSLGAWLAGLTLCTDARLGFAVLTTPIVSIQRAICELPFCEPVRRGLAGRTVDLTQFNLTGRTPRLGGQDLLLVESRHDLFAPAETVEELWRAWSEPEIWRLAHGHISVLMSRRVLQRTVRWIAGRCGR